MDRKSQGSGRGVHRRFAEPCVILGKSCFGLYGVSSTNFSCGGITGSDSISLLHDLHTNIGSRTQSWQTRLPMTWLLSQQRQSTGCLRALRHRSVIHSAQWFHRLHIDLALYSLTDSLRLASPQWNMDYYCALFSISSSAMITHAFAIPFPNPRYFEFSPILWSHHQLVEGFISPSGATNSM